MPAVPTPPWVRCPPSLVRRRHPPAVPGPRPRADLEGVLRRCLRWGCHSVPYPRSAVTLRTVQPLVSLSLPLPRPPHPRPPHPRSPHLGPPSLGSPRPEPQLGTVPPQSIEWCLPVRRLSHAPVRDLTRVVRLVPGHRSRARDHPGWATTRLASVVPRHRGRPASGVLLRQARPRRATCHHGRAQGVGEVTARVLAAPARQAAVDHGRIPA
jgi:hypothetical protein